MNAALPAGIKLNSETIYIGHDELNHSLDQLDGDEYTLAAAILYQSEIKHRDVEILLNKKRVYPVIKALLNKGLIEIKEVLKSIYKPKRRKSLFLCLKIPMKVLDRSLNRSKMPESRVRLSFS